MAETLNINWNLPVWQRIEFSQIPEYGRQAWNHPFATRIRIGAQPAVAAWWANVSPARMGEKSAAWWIGYGVGVAESALIVLNPVSVTLPGGVAVTGSMAKGLVNGGANQVWQVVGHYLPDGAKPVGEEVLKGVAAGALHASLVFGVGGLVAEGARSAIVGLGQIRLPEFNMPRIEAPDLRQVPGAVGETFNRIGTGIHTAFGRPVMPWDRGWHIPGTTPPELVYTPPGAYPGDLSESYGGGATPVEQPQPVPRTGPEPVQPRPVEPGRAPIPGAEPGPAVPQGPNLAEKAEVFENNQSVQTAVAAEVGRILAGVPENSPLYPQIQYILETRGNESMENAIEYVLAQHPDFDPNNPEHIKFVGDAARATFAQDYEAQGLDEVIKTLVPTADAGPQNAVEQIQQLVEANINNPEVFTDHIVQNGETAGHILQEMGIPPSWDGKDLYGFAALWFSNPEAFKDIATGMGLSPEELLKLVQQAQGGDLSAARKVYKGMSFIGEGRVLKLPAQQVVEQLKRLATV